MKQMRGSLKSAHPNDNHCNRNRKNISNIVMKNIDFISVVIGYCVLCGVLLADAKNNGFSYFSVLTTGIILFSSGIVLKLYG